MYLVFNTPTPALRVATHLRPSVGRICKARENTYIGSLPPPHCASHLIVITIIGVHRKTLFLLDASELLVNKKKSKRAEVWKEKKPPPIIVTGRRHEENKKQTQDITKPRDKDREDPQVITYIDPENQKKHTGFLIKNNHTKQTYVSKQARSLLSYPSIPHFSSACSSLPQIKDITPHNKPQPIQPYPFPPRPAPPCLPSFERSHHSHHHRHKVFVTS